MKDASGAAISDAVAGSMCWCPITSLDYADEAYEWNMGQFLQRTPGPTAPSRLRPVQGPGQAAYADYINS
jgi:hypothetical protein